MDRRQCWWLMKLRMRCPAGVIQRLRGSEPRRLHPRHGALKRPWHKVPTVALAKVLVLALAEVLVLAAILVLPRRMAARPRTMARNRYQGCWGAFCKLRWLWAAA